MEIILNYRGYSAPEFLEWGSRLKQYFLWEVFIYRVSRMTALEVRGGGVVGCAVFWIWLSGWQRRDSGESKEWTLCLTGSAPISMQCEQQTGVHPLISTVTLVLSTLQNQIALQTG